MNPARERYYRGLFAVAAIYDLVLGFTFIFFRRPVFAALNISAKLPTFGGYLTLLGMFVLVLGIGYALIAYGSLRRNQDLIAVGTLYKLGYAVVAIFYWVHGDLPHVIFGAVFGVADAIFFVLMLECLLRLRRGEVPTRHP